MQREKKNMEVHTSVCITCYGSADLVTAGQHCSLVTQLYLVLDSLQYAGYIFMYICFNCSVVLLTS